MTIDTKAAGEILKNAGKATLLLQVFAAILLVALGILYIDMSERQAALQDSVRENAMWSAYQLDREARTLDYQLGVMVVAEDFSAPSLKMLAQRFDILYSRVEILGGSKFSSYFEGDEEVRSRLTVIRKLVHDQVALIDRISATKAVGREEIKSLSRPFEGIAIQASQLLVYTNNASAVARAENRIEIEGLQHKSAIILILLLASVFILIITLRRQLKSLKNAGLGLQSITQELMRAYNAADAGNRAKSQFMATMGHEVRTPLNAILGTAELMESSKLDEEDLANIRTIRSSGEALLEVINEILDYSKIEHGQLEIEIRNVDIRDLVTKTANIIATRANAQGTELRLVVPDSLQAPIILTDPTRLRQVLLNLLSNAVKFTDRGQVTLRLSEYIQLGILRLRVEIEDTGIGIDPAGREKLFKPFSQVDASISRKYGGTGLGLTICKQIVEQLGGLIGVESTVGKGSIFWFDIPVEAAVIVTQQTQPAKIELVGPLPPLEILLVEDNPVNRQVAIRFLAKLGQNPVIAKHGGEAVEMTAAATFDLILMDMQMPIMDGIEATRRIKARGGPSAVTPICAMTANASDEDRQHCIEAGMEGFELKPITIARMHNLLEKIARKANLYEGTGSNGLPLEVVSVETANDDEHQVDKARREELVDVLGEDIYIELIQSFFADTENLLADLNIALNIRDETGIDAALHTIKGAAANVGLPGLARQAEGLRKYRPTETEITLLAQSIENARKKLAA